jgi:hypothetical protein
MGLSPWKTWLLKANGLKFLGGNMTTEGKWAQVFMEKCGFPMFFVAWGKSWFLKEFLGSFASSSRKTLGSNTPSPLPTCFNLISLFKQLGQHNEPNCTMINAFP